MERQATLLGAHLQGLSVLGLIFLLQKQMLDLVLELVVDSAQP